VGSSKHNGYLTLTTSGPCPKVCNLILEQNKPVVSLCLLVADTSTCEGDSASIRLLAKSLPRDRFRVTVAVLGSVADQRFDEILAGAIPICSLPIRHVFDLNGVRRLQQKVREIDPDVIHAWGPVAASAARFVISRRADGTNSPRLAVSGATMPLSGFRGWFMTRQVRRADRVILKTRVDGERYRQFGVPSERLTLISPAAPSFPTEPSHDTVRKSLNIPVTSGFLIAGGRSDRGIGPKEAIVAFDMLRYDHPNLYLIVFGSGREAITLEQFGRALAFDDFRIRFVEYKPERSATVQLATAVLITHAQGGVEEALEAMAAGKPVVGWRTSELAEIVDDGVTGFLVPVADRAALSAKARQLLEEPDLARRMGEAGRARAAARFGVGRMIEQYSRLYEELVGPIR
jgi:glycosyltransferase involved in cell wall biosynthesis